ncbi:MULTISPECIES: thiamine pyrophosphate-dependent enzyme [Dictyoglomus]|uniref:Thiamine pyrophosphate protein domain protein TPP-binding n=1 Tax=Dictyoglomus turgidum (strain DSM 6724 / Z-1310) TaxID=515635 RepID=B8DYW3_DICTD|nr:MULTISPECIES: thiamine pyrophosphate-dependent enzyme [Dictyoglomus]ACK41589.1 thiamine pyrophosphate protein domain protein TPP-binding [Dictyoglomus turgidum DSM 6724]HBU31692.1 pyruvate ferredoxin oxidoreductase [Dictyoglomus sp.]
MAINLRELALKEERLVSGHRLCAGCGASIVVRMVLNAIDEPVVVANATGCLEVATTIFPFNSWNVPWIHSAFENAAATIAGVEAAYRALKKKGEIDREIRFISFSGDGGTYDIGLQALSGAVERGHRAVFICYNNEAYMNTGIQRSSATPRGAFTTTSPAGKVVPGKPQRRKNLTEMMVANGARYVAQASPSHWRDLMEKVRKAVNTDGPAFLNIYSTCPRGWRTPDNSAINIARLAVETGVWPLYEVEDGKYKINYKPPKGFKPVEEFLKVQGRFAHLLKPENTHILEEIKKDIEAEWKRLLSMEEATNK